MATNACVRCGNEMTGLQVTCPHCPAPPPLPRAAPDFGGLVFSQPYDAMGARSSARAGGRRWVLPVAISAIIGLAATAVVIGLIKVGTAVRQDRQANEAALKEIEALVEARKASVEGQPAANAPGPTRSVDEGTLLQRAAVIMAKFQREASAADVAHMEALSRLQLDQVLTPQRLSSRDGIRQNRIALDQALSNLDGYEWATHARLRAFEAEIKTLEGLRGFEDFMRGFNSQRQKTFQRNNRALVNQRQLFAAALAVTDFTASRIGSMEVQDDVILFPSDGEAAEYNRLIERVNALAAEEEQIRVETLAALDQHAGRTRALKAQH